MKSIDDLKRETDALLESEREKRLDHQARDQRDGPILDAFDRPSRGETLASDKQSPRRHAPRLGVVPVKVTEQCPASPGEFAIDEGHHECLEAEMRCAYCGARLAPYPCNGCGKFLTAKRMHDAALDGIWRCEDCS